ncbi:MAG: RNA 2',3'-cyclic phosphodiesterase [Vulcanimicrobiota bacterium]
MRLFIAVKLPTDAAQSVSELVERLRPQVRGVKWVDPGLMHFTLKFLGETEPSRLGQIQAALAQVQAAPFEVQLEAAGAFPNQGRPRVLWVGVSDGAQPMSLLAEQIEQVLGRPREERPFKPHLTIGRIKRPTRQPDLQLPQARLARFRVESFELIRSQLTPAGPKYHVLSSFGLHAGAKVATLGCESGSKKV